MAEQHGVWAWRHPRPEGAAGRCIGHTDLPVNRRRAKRLARRIQAAARRHGLVRVVYSSPLQRCADVGRWLRRWGWRHCIDKALIEMNFGAWDGCDWREIGAAEVDVWCADFAQHAPGGGEALAAFMQRAAAWAGREGVVVAHAGWLIARQWQAAHPDRLPRADEWPAAPAYGRLAEPAPQA